MSRPRPGNKRSLTPSDPARARQPSDAAPQSYDPLAAHRSPALGSLFTSSLAPKLSLFLTLALLTVVLFQCVTPVSPDLYWDTDPRFRSPTDVNATFGPSDLAWCNFLCAAIAAATLFLRAATRKSVAVWAVALAAVGVVACAIHAQTHNENLYRCGAWVGAICAGLAAAHLARERANRRWIVAALIALTVMLALRAGSYVLIEQPMTVAFHLEHREKFLQDRNWTLDSAQYQLFLRRLQDWQVTGVFGLSNVFGSVMAAITAATIGSCVMAWRRGRRTETASLLALALIGAVTVVLSKSKGAMAALAIAGAMSLMVAWLHARQQRKNTQPQQQLLHEQTQPPSQPTPPQSTQPPPSDTQTPTSPNPRPPWLVRWGLPILALACVALPLLAVWACYEREPSPTRPVRNLSLLVRGQYWEAAARMMSFQPTENFPGVIEFVGVANKENARFQLGVARHPLWPGVSPAGFTDLYLLFKSPFNPEEIVSTHNVFIDYVVMLGIGGLAWSALLLAWLVFAARGAVPSEHNLTRSDVKPNRPAWMPALLLGTAIFVPQFLIQRAALGPDGALLWIVGVAGFVIIVAMLVERGLSDAAMRVSLFLAALVLIVHNQVEMTFFQPGAMTLAWMVLGAASTSADDDESEKENCHAKDSVAVSGTSAPAKVLGALPWIASLVLFTATAGLVWVHLVPTIRKQELLQEASTTLQSGDTLGSIEQLRAAEKFGPVYPDVVRWRIQLLLEANEGLKRAGRDGEAGAAGREAMDAAWSLPSNASALRGRVQILQRLDDGRQDAYPIVEDVKAVGTLGLLSSICALAPQNWQDWVVAGDWRLNRAKRLPTDHQDSVTIRIRHGEWIGFVQDCYRNAIRASDAAFLDPAKQMPKETRERLERAIAELSEQIKVANEAAKSTTQPAND